MALNVSVSSLDASILIFKPAKQCSEEECAFAGVIVLGPTLQ